MHNNTQSSLYLYQQATLQDPSPPLTSKPLPPLPKSTTVPEPVPSQASETTTATRTVRKRVSRDSGAGPPHPDDKPTPSISSSKHRTKRYKPPKVSTAAGDSARSEIIAESSTSGITSTSTSSRRGRKQHSTHHTSHKDPESHSQSTASYASYGTPSTYTDSTITSTAPSTVSSSSVISRRIHDLRKRILPSPEERTPDFNYSEAERYLNGGLLIAACSVALIYLPVEATFRKSVDKASGGKHKGGKHVSAEKANWKVKGDSVEKPAGMSPGNT